MSSDFARTLAPGDPGPGAPGRRPTDPVSWWAFAYDEVADVGALGEDTGHDFGQKVDHALALDQPADGQQHFAPAQAAGGRALQVAHPLLGVVVVELAHIDAVRYDFAQRR